MIESNDLRRSGGLGIRISRTNCKTRFLHNCFCTAILSGPEPICSNVVHDLYGVGSNLYSAKTLFGGSVDLSYILADIPPTTQVQWLLRPACFLPSTGERVLSAIGAPYLSTQCDTTPGVTTLTASNILSLQLRHSIGGDADSSIRHA